jgi:hypothetical protein
MGESFGSAATEHDRYFGAVFLYFLPHDGTDYINEESDDKKKQFPMHSCVILLQIYAIFVPKPILMQDKF